MREVVPRIQLPYLFTGYQDTKRKDGTNHCVIFFLIFFSKNQHFFLHFSHTNYDCSGDSGSFIQHILKIKRKFAEKASIFPIWALNPLL